MTLTTPLLRERVWKYQIARNACFTTRCVYSALDVHWSESLRVIFWTHSYLDGILARVDFLYDLNHVEARRVQNGSLFESAHQQGGGKIHTQSAGRMSIAAYKDTSTKISAIAIGDFGHFQ